MKPRHAPRTAPLIASLVVAIAAVTLILSTATFLRSYRQAIVEGARTSSSQAVSQVVGSVGNYVDNIDEIMDLVMDSMNQSPEERNALLDALQTTRSEVIAITTYDADGVLQDCWAKDHTPRQNILRNSSFDLVTAKRRGRGYVSIPHVETIFEGYYPWVVSVVRRMPEDSPRQWISMDIRFSALAATINNVGIGQHGYCYLMDERGNMVYHPQQQLLYAGLKKEEAGRLACLGDGTYVEDTVIYTTQKVPNSTWRVVGVSYIDETVNESFWQMTRIILIAAALILVAAVVVGFVLSCIISRPLQKLETAMEAFEQNADGFVFNSITGTREVEELSDSFCHMVGRIQRLMTAVREEEVALRKTELKALQAQINPHFLYNTLDLINWISMDYGAEEIGTLTWNLARFYRLSLNHGKSLISIGEEVEHVEVYVNIENYHFDNAISLEVDVPEELKSYACLNIILQPFVENAIVHGIAEKPDIESCEIRICARREEQDIVFSVQDDGPGVDVKEMQKETQQDIRTAQHGYGVRNINFRLKLCFGEKYGVTYLESEKGTHVEIKIPVMTMAEAEEKI